VIEGCNLISEILPYPKKLKELKEEKLLFYYMILNLYVNFNSVMIHIYLITNVYFFLKKKRYIYC